MMKKLFFIPVMLLAFLFTGCSSDITEEVNTPVKVNTTVVFDIVDQPQTRAASANEENWPEGQKEIAEEVVKDVYTSQMNTTAKLTSFLTSNYDLSFKIDNKEVITAWDGHADISLTQVNNISVTLTPKSNLNKGVVPYFETSTGAIDLTKTDLDSEHINKSGVGSGAIVVDTITNINGSVNVQITVKLSYNSFLLVAPKGEYSILNNTKAFTSVCWDGKSGTEFQSTTVTVNNEDYEWFYGWAQDGDYIYGAGTWTFYGFNFYTSGNKPTLVNNGYWYGLFASWSSIGEGDDDNDDPNDPDDDPDKHHTTGNDGGVTPKADNVVSGGAIR